MGDQALLLSNLQGQFFLDTHLGISGLLRNWEQDINRATAAYIDAASSSLIATMNAESDPTKPLREWFECWAPVFTGIPSAIATAPCNVKAYLRNLTERLKECAEELAMQIPLVADFVREINELEEKAKDAAVDAGIEFSDRVFGEAFTKFYLVHSKHYSDEDLNKAFDSDSSGKQLLTFDEASILIRGDLKMAAGAQFFDPMAFPPTAHALTLAKLALLDINGIDELTTVYGMTKPTVYAFESDDSDRKQFIFPDPKRFENILFRSVQSIDGNQQWRGMGLPYLRRTGTPENTKGNKFGYCFSEDNHSGFRMWVDPEYRKNVFAKLFPGELKMASLAPSIAKHIPQELLDREAAADDCGSVSGAPAEQSRPVQPPIIRDDKAREELEKERQMELTEIPSVALLDRIDGKDQAQVLAALRQQIRTELAEEIRKEVLDELRAAQQWGDDYDRQRLLAQEGGKPLLVVVEGKTAKGAFPFDRWIAGELQGKLLAPFVLCKVGVDSEAGERALRRFGGSFMPLIFLIDPKTEAVISTRKGSLDHVGWAALLVSLSQSTQAPNQRSCDCE